MLQEEQTMNYYETDPEFMERMEYFALEEVVNEPGQEDGDSILRPRYRRTCSQCGGYYGCAA